MEDFVYYDISPEINSQIAVYPTDKKFRRHISHNFAKGDSYELSWVEMSLHTGSHTDAPSHYDSQGEDISKRSLSYYYGPCQVISVQIPKGERIFSLAQPVKCPRVLFQTNSFSPNTWNKNFNSLSPELITNLNGQGVFTVGIDTPSVDPSEDKELLSHQKVAQYNMSILEGLVLHHVPEGLYHLVALPLKISSAEASPVRAILVP